jgi:chemotaxis protein methyltransferase CheR
MLDDLDIELPLLLEAIYLRYHYDFRAYARAPLRRRVMLALPRLGCSSTSMLQDRILRDPEAFRALLPYLTIGVSEMFRDPSFFRALRERVVPYLDTFPSLRVWVAGCSTGEEVYSLAILLREEGLLDRTTIYATDINPDALRKAAAGIFPLDRMAQFSASYREAGGKGSLADHYTAAYDAARFDPSLQAGVVFADHSLTTDGVFAEVQLVTCRNVLIYFDQPLQQRALGLFRDALCPLGFLGLGSRETLGVSSPAEGFSTIDRDQRIYQRR